MCVCVLMFVCMYMCVCVVVFVVVVVVVAAVVVVVATVVSYIPARLFIIASATTTSVVPACVQLSVCLQPDQRLFCFLSSRSINSDHLH